MTENALFPDAASEDSTQAPLSPDLQPAAAVTAPSQPEEVAASVEAPAASTAPDEQAAVSLAHPEPAPAKMKPEAPPEPEEEEAPAENLKRWYAVKVQSGREDTIKEAIERRVRKEGLEEYFGQIVIPVEKVTEVKTDKNGKRVTRTRDRKLYPGYLVVEVEYNDRIVYLFRETSGVGDFVGAHPGDLTKPPTPMSDAEVARMVGRPKDPHEKAPPPKPKWLQDGDRVKVVDGTFNGMEGIVKQIQEAVSKVQVELTIFGRPVAIELEYYQVEQL